MDTEVLAQLRSCSTTTLTTRLRDRGLPERLAAEIAAAAVEQETLERFLHKRIAGGHRFGGLIHQTLSHWRRTGRPGKMRTPAEI